MRMLSVIIVCTTIFVSCNNDLSDQVFPCPNRWFLAYDSDGHELHGDVKIFAALPDYELSDTIQDDHLTQVYSIDCYGHDSSFPFSMDYGYEIQLKPGNYRFKVYDWNKLDYSKDMHIDKCSGIVLE